MDKSVSSVLESLPPSTDKHPCRPYFSCSTQELAQIETIATNPTLPFDGDTNLVMRTFIRSGILSIRAEEVDQDSYLQSLKPILGHELMKWSLKACDDFAMNSVDHLATAVHVQDLKLAEEFVDDVCLTVEAVQHKTSKLMIKNALVRRKFLDAVASLRQEMLEADMEVYYLDTLIAEVFG